MEYHLHSSFCCLRSRSAKITHGYLYYSVSGESAGQYELFKGLVSLLAPQTLATFFDRTPV